MPMLMRQSIISVKPGKRQDVEKLFDEFEDNSTKQKGYVLGFRYTIPEQPEMLAHIDLWANSDALAHNVVQDHILVLRSKLLSLSDSNKNSEKQYVVHGTTKNFPKPVA